ncbi:extracellular solute-binding protein [Cellulosilyticum sp. I15G10I2]|uniref:extracellular solute-binding protein n=1 Tax=Cellulosilyticum sp. I15G10I2 TaxID=1892843 RepID=UPI00085BDB3C|nr:extracellular solute-binding protein [Cellulosilyticum sp. I15G10I2]
MATIKDVATVAGVSVGSVSNVINGKTNNQELIDKVEEAIKNLGFRPDANARSLKNTQTNIIGIIVSNVEEPRIQVMIAAIEKKLRASGYSILIKTTDNNAILEKKHIEHFVQQRVDGVIVSTAVQNKDWLHQLSDNNIPVVFMDKKISMKNNMNVITINYTEAFLKCLLWCKDHQHTKVGLILENGIMFEQELEALKDTSRQELLYKVVGDYSSESGFKAAYELLYEHPDITVLILSSYMMLQGAKKAIEILKEKASASPLLICIKAENWIEDDNTLDGVINVSYYEMGTTAAKQIVEAAQTGGLQYTQIKTLDAVFKVANTPFYTGKDIRSGQRDTINVAILDARVAKVLPMLTKVYEKEHGIKVNFIAFEYHELWEYIVACIHQQDTGIDIFMYDLVWLEDLVKMSGLKPITDLQKKRESYFEDIIDRALENHGVYHGELYGLPFMTGTQMLFYQKDLFEDMTLKIQFQRKYGKELILPKTWDEFNLIAEFFTRKYNLNSPLQYGTALINKGNLYNSIEFLNRLWAYGGAIITDNRITINSDYAHIALDSYKKSYQYTNTESSYETWSSIASDFKCGSTAMAVLYDSYAFGINDSMESKVAGNVGSCILPGQCPVLGGWSLGINPSSTMQQAAIEYMMWACGRSIASPFAVLSGISSRKSFYADQELDGLYPWKRNILKSYAKSKKRELLSTTKTLGINIKLYDEIIGQEIGKALRGVQSNSSTLEHIEQRIYKLMEK